MRKYAGQAITPAAVAAAELAIELTERLAALRLGLGGNEIGNGFGLQQIELAVVKGPAGELSRLGEPQPEAAQRLHDGGEHGAAAVHMEFGDVFPGGAARAREPQYQRVIEPLSGRGVDQAPSYRSARWRQLARDVLDGAPAIRPTEAENGDGGATGRRRRGENRVGGGRSSPQCFGGSCSG